MFLSRLFFLIFFLFGCVRKDQKLCSDVILHGENIDLTETEINMACGDRKNPAYSDIPGYQASYFLTGFLQSRGYLKPKFDLSGEVLHVKVGKKTKIKKFYMADNGNHTVTSPVKKKIRHLYRSELLTPRTLNAIEEDALRQIRMRGFPCAKIKSTADAGDSSVTLDIKDTKAFAFGPIPRDHIEGLHIRALDRFYPFKDGDLFDGQLLELTEKRMLRTEVVQGTYFLENCAPDLSSFSATQEFIIGPPRTIRFGVGATTEQGPMVRARWSHNRYGDMASNLSANAQASFKTQSLTLGADSFIWRKKPRESILSELDLTRQSQSDYNEVVLKIKSHKKWTQDAYARFWTYTLGPSFESGTFSTTETNTKSFKTGVVEGSLSWMSHIYEFFDVHPEEGDQFQFNFGFRHPGLGFSDPLLKLDSTFAKIKPISGWGRGELIGALRLNASTTWVSDDVSLESLPPSVKSYGGGSDDIRGFLIRTLPRNDGLGALTKLGGKFEFRKTYLFIKSLEAFSFFDGAYFGDNSWNADPRLYYAPGVGLRWISPIGLVQAYAARAYITEPYTDEGNYFFLGLGGTF